MSSTTQPQDFSDLFTDLMNRAREETSLTATIEQAKRYINIALQDMHVGEGEKFPWAERRAILTTHPKYTTGTLAISQGDNALVGTDTFWKTVGTFGTNNMIVGGKIVIVGGTEVYGISAVGSDTTATLDSIYTQADQTAAEYVYFEDEYTLESDFLRPIDQQYFDDGVSIDLIGRTEFRRRYPRNRIPGRPFAATITDHPNTSGTSEIRKIRFHPPPEEAISIPYAYVTSNLAISSSGTAAVSLSADADEPIVPLRYRHAIVYHALNHWYRDKKDDARSQEAAAEFARLMLRVGGDFEIGGARPQFRPKVGTYLRRARRPYGGSRGRYDLNGRFDRLETN